ncbi:hypothetical protein llg_11140 [Luteolibacter sp. LG18]|nr:hypothetical protein llg_11140 [Luteolibacter sp. LG18]
MREGEPVSLDFVLSSQPFLNRIGSRRKIRKFLRKLIFGHYGEREPLYFILWTSTEAVSQFMIKQSAYRNLPEARKNTIAKRWQAVLEDMMQAASDRAHPVGSAWGPMSN